MPSLQTTVRSAARELTGADGASFVLRQGDFCFYADEDAIEPLWKGQRFPMEKCVSGWVMHNRKPALIEDIYNDDRVPAEAYRPTFVTSMAMVPIRTMDPIGAIGNYWAHKHQPTQLELQILQALADSTAVALESIRILDSLEERVRQRTRDLEAANAQISQLSLVDDLTGLNNRRGFLLLAEQERKAAERLHAQVFILFIDADGLKRVNDSFGHESGDQMLRDLAQILKSTFRQSDILARFGGDEFCVFGLHEDGDPKLAKERLDGAIASFNASRSAPFKLSASSGLYTFPADRTCLLEDAIACADKAMYAEKEARRASVASASYGRGPMVGGTERSSVGAPGPELIGGGAPGIAGG
jgi:diguanylate cyclase (GGDEF)-like protein